MNTDNGSNREGERIRIAATKREHRKNNNKANEQMTSSAFALAVAVDDQNRYPSASKTARACATRTTQPRQTRLQVTRNSATTQSKCYKRANAPISSVPLKPKEVPVTVTSVPKLNELGVTLEMCGAAKNTSKQHTKQIVPSKANTKFVLLTSPVEENSLMIMFL